MNDKRPGYNVSELVDQHYALLYRYAYRLSGSAVEAEDLTQQTFLTAQSKLHQLRQPEHAKAWLFTILRNIFLKNVRVTGKVSTISLEQVVEPSDEPTAIEQPLVQQELQTILNELSEEFLTPLILYYFDDLSYKQIAEQMDIPMGTVMSRLARAKDYLRQRLNVCVAMSRHTS